MDINTEVGLAVMEQVFGNNLWIHYIENDEDILNAVNGVSFSWRGDERDMVTVSLAIRKDNQWLKSSKKIILQHEDDAELFVNDVDIYGTATSLVGDIFGK